MTIASEPTSTVSLASPRLIEKGFPSHQVGAETRRERNASSALPPHFFLHVWWARRPLTPSAAAILGSLLSSRYSHSEFLKRLGLVNYFIQTQHGKIQIPHQFVIKNHEIEITRPLLTELNRQNVVRSSISRVEGLTSEQENLWNTWLAESDLSELNIEDTYPLFVEAASPSDGNKIIDLEGLLKIRTNLDKYGYSRAYKTRYIEEIAKDIIVLDPTSGGGSIPLESLRIGANAIANELNPVALVILHATLEFPNF